jgi:Uncharacterised protein family UPF0547
VNRLARIVLVASLVIAVLMLLGGVLNHETPPAFWVALAWVLIVVVFNAWIGGRRPRKQCPDCSETVLSAANVCRHCGYRFEDQPSTTVAEP